MNYNKELNLTHSKSKAQRWCIGLFLGLIVTFGIINFGCQCDCEEATDEYYVKYEIYGDAYLYSRVMVDITVNDENNNDVSFTFNAVIPWETIIGPVQKGFNATLKVSVETAILLHAKIYVSKNDSPFAIKANDSSDDMQKFCSIKLYNRLLIF